MFSNIYQLLTIHQDQEKIFNIRGEYHTTNPAKWRKSYRISPVTGIGDNKTAEKVMSSQMMLNIVNSLANAGAEGILYDWETIYDLLLELTQNSGFDEPQRFWLDPRSPDGKIAIQKLEEAKAKPSADDLKKQAETQEIGERVKIDASKAKAEHDIKMLELEVRKREASVKEREIDLEQQRIELETYKVQMNHAATVAELELEQQQGRAVKLGDRQTPNNPTDGDLPNN
jgi:hypothetical protein